jgi:hypothetical protein
MPRPGPISRSLTTQSTAVRPNPAPIAFVSHQPSPAYRQHHDVVAPRIDSASFRPAWLVQTRLWSLFDAGKIDQAALDAALTWRRWAEGSAPTKVQSWEVRIDMPAGSNDGAMLSRIAAAGRLRDAAAALGRLRIAILEACVLRDVSWLELSRLLRVSDKTARDRAAEAITALATWRAGEPVPPPPELRFRNQPGSW